MKAIVDPRSTRQLRAERLHGAAALREAQALRYRVFSNEFDAQLHGAEFGLDMDDFDIHCRHIGVRDLATGELVATTRLPQSSLDASTAKASSPCTVWRRSTSRCWKSAAPALHRPIATGRPSRCCGANWPRYSTRAAIAT